MLRFKINKLSGNQIINEGIGIVAAIKMDCLVLQNATGAYYMYIRNILKRTPFKTQAYVRYMPDTLYRVQQNCAEV